MNLDQESLLRKAKESLRAADLLVKEGLHDIAVSRSYYCMFYIAEAFLLKKDVACSKHSAVISAFGKYFSKTKEVPAIYHRNLLDAFDLRSIGDYSTDTGFSKEDADEQISKAKEFLEYAEKCL